MSNDRCHERFPVHNVVQVGSDAHRPHDIEYLHDVSDGGLNFFSTHAWPRGKPIHIVIQTDQTFTIPAVIRWCRTHANGFQVGVAFNVPADGAMVASLQEMESTLAMYRATAVAL